MSTDEETKKERKKILREKLPYWRNQEKPKEGEKFTDPEFPPDTRALLGLDKNNNIIDSKSYNENKSSIKSNEVTFIRASELFQGQKYLLFKDTIEMGDIEQGELGDCYFLASVANLTQFQGLIFGLFKTKDIKEEGYFEIIFHIDGQEQIVIIDDYLPVFKKSKKPCYAQPHGNEIWVMLLEKAWAKVNGGYANIIGGNPNEALEALTGFGSVSFDLEKVQSDDLKETYEAIIEKIKLADQKDCIISCSTSSTNKHYEEAGLVEGHAYSLLDVVTVKKNDKDIVLLKIRNPWNKGEWKGDWSDSSKLWGEEQKQQANYSNKNDGVFFMCINDFFKYFTKIQICSILYGVEVIEYKVEGDDLKDGNVFNLEIEEKGFLSVSIKRKNWRTNREIRDKSLTSHLSLVKYDSKATSKLKTFSNYSGATKNLETCCINTQCEPGNYLLYAYQDRDHCAFENENYYIVEIYCSGKYKHSQMACDLREEGYPLLQNIILQSYLENEVIDPDSGEEINANQNELKGNGLGFHILNITNPGYFLDYTGDASCSMGYTIISPYTSGSFHRCISAGRYLVLLGLLNIDVGSYCFCLMKAGFTTNRKLDEENYNNDVDLTLWTDSSKKVESKTFKTRRSINKNLAKFNFYFEGGDGVVTFKSKEELTKLYPSEMKMLEEIPNVQNDSELSWGILKDAYVTYIGQFNKANNNVKEGKGVLTNPKNIFAGQFKDDRQHGIGIIYNSKKVPVLSCNFENGRKKGRPTKYVDGIKQVTSEEAAANANKNKTTTDDTKNNENKNTEKVEGNSSAKIENENVDIKKTEEDKPIDNDKKIKQEEVAINNTNDTNNINNNNINDNKNDDNNPSNNININNNSNNNITNTDFNNMFINKDNINQKRDEKRKDREKREKEKINNTREIYYRDSNELNCSCSTCIIF